MNPNKKTQIVNTGDTRMLVASLNFPRLQNQNMITWKKKTYSKDEVKTNPLRLLFALEDNGEVLSLGKELSTSYKFTQKDIGKYIKFYSYCKEFNALAQCMVFYVEEKHTTNIRIRGVERIEAKSPDIHVGEKVKLKVNYSVEDKKVPSKTKENVKWMVKIGGEVTRLIIDGLVIIGSEIEFTAPKEWAEKEVTLMPYLYKHTEDVSVTIVTKVNYPKDITCWWTNELSKDEITEAKIHDILYFEIEMPENIKDEEVTLELYYEQGEDRNKKTGIKSKQVQLLNGKGSVVLDLISELEKVSTTRNDALKEWEKIVNLDGAKKLATAVTSHFDWRPFDKNVNINLYWKMKYSRGEKYLIEKKMSIYFDIHIFNILDNHYRYTCHGGWIDKAHFNTKTPKRNATIGAEGLWKRIKNEEGEVAPHILRADHWFVITYRQDMGFSKIYKYVERVYLIKKGLSIDLKKKVCMTIFREVSYEFEDSQAFGAPESSFEISDLVSNMLGLYTVIEGYSPSDVLKELKEVDARTSVKIYLKDLKNFTHRKNKKFLPEFPGEDECPHTPKCIPEFPDKFQKIEPFAKISNKMKPHQTKFVTNPEKILLDITLPDSQGFDL